MNDGLHWPVKTDGHDDETGQVQTESPHEGHDSAGGIPSLPRHSDVPADL